MANTPEGVVKDSIKALFREYGLIPSSKAVEVTAEHTGKYHMPVSNGMGVVGIPDFYGHFLGLYFEVEAKKNETEVPTPRQQHQLTATDVTGGKAFVVGGPASLAVLQAWLEEVRHSV